MGCSLMLPKGTSVTLIGYLARPHVAYAGFPSAEAHDLQRVAYAGVLKEDWRPGLAVLMEDGPFARSLSPRLVGEVVHLNAEGRHAAFRLYAPDEDGCVYYVLSAADPALLESQLSAARPSWALTQAFMRALQERSWQALQADELRVREQLRCACGWRKE